MPEYSPKTKTIHTISLSMGTITKSLDLSMREAATKALLAGANMAMMAN
jgi:hypothetical protein